MKKNEINDSCSIDLVIFDLDGTLIDSRVDIAHSINQGLLSVGAPESSKETIFPLIGHPLIEIFHRLLPSELKNQAEEATNVYRRYYLHHCSDASRVYPGVIDCLGRLRAVPLAIATTKMTFMAVKVVKELGLAHYFKLVQGSDNIPHKPDPTLLNIVLNKLKKGAGNSWMVGDTIFDIQAGKAAGMRTCAITYGIGETEALKQEDPDLLLNSLSTLPDCLEIFSENPNKKNNRQLRV